MGFCFVIELWHPLADFSEGFQRLGLSIWNGFLGRALRFYNFHFYGYLVMGDTFERKWRTPAEREVFRQIDASEAVSEYAQTQEALKKNRERLKALRIARDAENQRK